MLENIKLEARANNFDDTQSDVGELVDLIARLTKCLEEVLQNRASTNNPMSLEMLHVTARNWLKRQYARSKYLPKSLLRDPGWNMLIDLYVQEREGRTVSISSACVASGGAMTTALRWITTLEEHGLILRTSDTNDGRRNFIGLTEEGRGAIEKWLHESR